LCGFMLTTAKAVTILTIKAVNACQLQKQLITTNRKGDEMAAMGRGGGKTPERIVAKISETVSELGQNGAARAIGIPLRSLQKYLMGISEPTQATLEKLAAYFEVSVAWLRGEEESDRKNRILKSIEKTTGKDMIKMVVKSLFGGEEETIKELKKAGFTDKEAKLFIESVGDRFGKTLLPGLLEKFHISIFKPLIDRTFHASYDETKIDKNELEAIRGSLGEKLDIEIIKPTIHELALMPVSELPGIAAIIKRFRENDKFNLEARKLLNNSIAHDKH